MFIVRKPGQEKKIQSKTSKFGVMVEFISAENYMQMSAICEDALQDKDLSVVVTGLTEQSGRIPNE